MQENITGHEKDIFTVTVHISFVTRIYLTMYISKYQLRKYHYARIHRIRHRF